MEYLNHQENKKAFNEFRNNMIKNRNELYKRMRPEALEVFTGKGDDDDFASIMQNVRKNRKQR